MYGIVVPLVGCGILTYALCRRLSGNRRGRREAGLLVIVYLLMRLNVAFICLSTQFNIWFCPYRLVNGLCILCMRSRRATLNRGK